MDATADDAALWTAVGSPPACRAHAEARGEATSALMGGRNSAQGTGQVVVGTDNIISNASIHQILVVVTEKKSVQAYGKQSVRVRVMNVDLAPGLFPRRAHTYPLSRLYSRQRNQSGERRNSNERKKMLRS